LDRVQQIEIVEKVGIGLETAAIADVDSRGTSITRVREHVNAGYQVLRLGSGATRVPFQMERVFFQALIKSYSTIAQAEAVRHVHRIRSKAWHLEGRVRRKYLDGRWV
jgi:hypothetical protein